MIARTEPEIRQKIIGADDPKALWHVRYNQIWNTGFNFALKWVLGEEKTPEQKAIDRLVAEQGAKDGSANL